MLLKQWSLILLFLCVILSFGNKSFSEVVNQTMQENQPQNPPLETMPPEVRQAEENVRAARQRVNEAQTDLEGTEQKAQERQQRVEDWEENTQADIDHAREQESEHRQAAADSAQEALDTHEAGKDLAGRDMNAHKTRKARAESRHHTEQADEQAERAEDLEETLGIQVPIMTENYTGRNSDALRAARRRLREAERALREAEEELERARARAIGAILSGEGIESAPNLDNVINGSESLPMPNPEAGTIAGPGLDPDRLTPDVEKFFNPTDLQPVEAPKAVIHSPASEPKREDVPDGYEKVAPSTLSF